MFNITGNLKGSNYLLVYPLKETGKKMQQVVKRRKTLLAVIPIIFVGLSFGALYIMEPYYESSISVMVQKEETLNPLLMYGMGVNVVPEDRLKSLNEIIYSRSTIETLIDSLGLDDNVKGELEKQELVNNIRENIKISSRTSDSFEITYADTDPVRARDGVKILSDRFIQTRLKLERKRNDETVKYFQEKVAELENAMERQGNQNESATVEVGDLAVDRDRLQSRFQTIEDQKVQLEWEIIQEENKLEVLNDFLNQNQNSQDFAIKPLYKLQLNDIPLGKELGELLDKYDVMNERYTLNYPELRELQTQIVEVTNRIETAVESNISNLKKQQVALEDKRSAIVNDLEKSFIAKQQQDSQQSEFTVYQNLHDEMKVKLEQAQISRDLGNKAKQEQFLVLDDPYIPQKPTSPDHAFIMSMGFVLGIVVAGIVVVIAEAFDTTIRREEDLKLKKPIIAYLKDGKV